MTQPADTLQITTPSDLEIVVTRVFDAPRELVFEAWTRPEHVRRWWSAPTSMLVCEADVRPGGTYRYVSQEQGGAEVPFTGVYREVTPPERLVYTEVYDVEPFNSGDPAVNTVTFTEQDGKTLMTLTTVFATKEVRDFVLGTGMEVGAEASYNRLGELLKTLA